MPDNDFLTAITNALNLFGSTNPAFPTQTPPVPTTGAAGGPNPIDTSGGSALPSPGSSLMAGAGGGPYPTQPGPAITGTQQGGAPAPLTRDTAARSGTAPPTMPGMSGTPEGKPIYSAVPWVKGMTPESYNDLSLVGHHESDFRNVKNWRYDAQHTAQGIYQITDTNWRAYAHKVGVHTDHAMDSSMEDQTKVALYMRDNTPMGMRNWTDFNPNLKADMDAGRKVTEPRTAFDYKSESGGYPGASKGVEDAYLGGKGAADGGSGGEARTGEDAASETSADTQDKSTPSPATSQGGGGTQAPAPAAPAPAAPAAPVTAAPAASTITPPTADTTATQPTSGNWLDSMLKVASNPLLQSALAGFYGYMAAPHGSSKWGRLGLGGLEGLKQFGEAEKTQTEAEKDKLEAAKSKLEEEKWGIEEKKDIADIAHTEQETITEKAKTAPLSDQARKTFEDRMANAGAHEASAIKDGLDAGLKPEDIEKNRLEGLKEDQAAAAQVPRTKEEESAARRNDAETAKANFERAQAEANKEPDNAKKRDDARKAKADADLAEARALHPDQNHQIEYKIGDSTVTKIKSYPKDQGANPDEGFTFNAPSKAAPKPEYMYNKDTDQWTSADIGSSQEYSLRQLGFVPARLPSGVATPSSWYSPENLLAHIPGYQGGGSAAAKPGLKIPMPPANYKGANDWVRDPKTGTPYSPTVGYYDGKPD